MLKKFLVATLFCVGVLGAITPEDPVPQVGRYQMVVSTHQGGGGYTVKTQHYLLDTATGHMWKSGLKNNWVDHDAWIPQITESPQYP